MVLILQRLFLQFQPDGLKPFLLLTLQTGAVTYKTFVYFIQQHSLILTQRQDRLLVIKCGHPPEQSLVGIIVVLKSHRKGNDLLSDVLHLLRCLSFQQIEKQGGHLPIHFSGTVNGHYSIFKVRRFRLICNHLQFQFGSSNSLFKGRQVIRYRNTVKKGKLPTLQ